jgi:hypothetical protein
MIRNSLAPCLLLLPLAACAQTDEKVLVRGNPPLTEKFVWEYALAMGALLDVSLKPADIDFLRQVLITDWKNEKSRAGAQKFVTVKRQLDTADSKKRDEALAQLRPRFRAALQELAQKPEGDDARYLLALGKPEPQAASTGRQAITVQSGDLIERIFTPRKQDDEDLDSEGRLDNETVSVYPKVERTDDALDNVFKILSANQHFLSEEDVRRMIRYFEWSLEVPLVNSERNRLRRAVIDVHEKDGGKSSRAYAFLSGGVGFKIGNVYLDSISNPFDDYKRRELQRQYIPLLKREAGAGDSLARLLYRFYEQQQPPLTGGENPLRPQVVRVYAEHVVFCLNEIASASAEKPVIKPTPQMQKALAKNLVASWPSLSEARQKELTDLPFDWAGTTKAWPGKSEAEKTMARIAWGKLYVPLFPELKPAHEKRVAAFERAQAQAKAEALKREKAEAARLAKLTPQQRAAEKLMQQQMAMNLAMMQMQSNFQTQQMAIQSMSAMQERAHQTNMDIIRGMDGRAWRYEYVYR